MNVLEDANKIIHGDRNDDYGHPLDNHGITAGLWGIYLGIELTPEQVCILNILQKISRSMNKMTRDTIVDIPGYSGNIEMIWIERARREAEELRRVTVASIHSSCATEASPTPPSDRVCTMTLCVYPNCQCPRPGQSHPRTTEML